MADHCATTNYTNYIDTAVYYRIYQPQSPVNLDVVNRCYYVAAAHGITVAQLLAWNPSLNANQSPCTLAAGYSYYVRNGNISGLCSLSRQVERLR